MQKITELEKVPFEKRDGDWIHRYSQALELVPLKVLNPQPQQGPDGFVYLLVSAGEGEDKLSDLVQWGADKGVGLVINPQKSNADLLLTYGMLWNYLVNKEFLSPLKSKSNNTLEFSANQQVLTGVPNESYWPPRARKLFKEFLLAQGIIQAKVILILDDDDQTQADLCFSLESLGNPPEKEWQGILEGFSWFFPRHYSLGLISEKTLATAQFAAV